MTKARYMNDFCEETKEWSDSYIGSQSKFPVMDLDDRLRAVEKRLLIIAPDSEVMDKYPALRDAYNHYKLIEKLTLGKDAT